MIEDKINDVASRLADDGSSIVKAVAYLAALLRCVRAADKLHVRTDSHEAMMANAEYIKARRALEEL